MHLTIEAENVLVVSFDVVLDECILRMEIWVYFLKDVLENVQVVPE
jgi:uncharacterized membrane protein